MSENRVNRRQFLKTGATTAVAVAAGITPIYTIKAGNPTDEKTDGIVNYNEQMEYRRCGKTDQMVSAVCLGGHWKRLNEVIPGLFQGGSWLSAKLDSEEFAKNRYDLVTRMIERGLNYIDACTCEEIQMYSKALKGRRDKMLLGFSPYQEEVRRPEFRTFEKLKGTLDKWMKICDLEHVDLWRIVLLSDSSKHTEAEMEEIIKALDWAKKTGRARFTGISSHDRPHVKWLIETYPEQLDVVILPYTTKTKVVDDADGLWATIKKHDIGWFGIKPYSSGAMFKGTGLPDDPHFKEDCKIARLTLRYVLCNPAITAPIPGMISPEQVDNAALAVMQRRELDVEEQTQLKEATDRAFANLPYHYQWLNDWNYV